MKKIILSLSLSLLVSGAVFAQDDNRPVGTVAKNGQNILPAAGDFAIGIEADPFLKYVGNMFNNSTNNTAPKFEGRQQTIYGKYFLTDESAVRVKLKFNLGKDQNSATVTNDYNTSTNPLDANATTVDYKEVKSNEFDLSLGYEIRRGYGRLQGFVGAEASIGFGSEAAYTDYTYGNKMTELNQRPSSWDFAGNVETPMGSRVTKSEGGDEFRLGLGAFVGVEYFFAPKISIGGELGLGFQHSNTKLGESTNEMFNASTGYVQTTKDRHNQQGTDSSRFRTVTEGSIFVMFHF